jgi:hypothetical protein
MGELPALLLLPLPPRLPEAALLLLLLEAEADCQTAKSIESGVRASSLAE